MENRKTELELKGLASRIKRLIVAMTQWLLSWFFSKKEVPATRGPQNPESYQNDAIQRRKRNERMSKRQKDACSQTELMASKKHKDDSWPEWASVEEDEVRKMLLSSRRPFNILVVGLPGAGKSSLISSLHSCLTHNHGKELAAAGFSTSVYDRVTVRLKKYTLIDSSSFGKQTIRSPMVFDMPGLNEFTRDNFKRMKTYNGILRVLIKGRVPVDTNLREKGLYWNNEEITKEYDYHTDYAEVNRIDRVIFVHSCERERPSNLIESVVSVCAELDVTLFSVLTHIDERSIIIEDSFEKALHTYGTPRRYRIELYHDKTEDFSRYNDNHRTNYFLYKLWQTLLNENYPIHSKYD